MTCCQVSDRCPLDYLLYIRTPSYFTVNTLKIKIKDSTMSPQGADCIANSEDFDQTDLDLHCLTRPGCPKIKDHFKYFLFFYAGETFT